MQQAPGTPQSNQGFSFPFFNSSQQPTPFVTSPLEVVQTDPADQETDAPLSLAVAITFSRPLDSTEKQTIKLGFTPIASGSSSWSQDNTQLIFTPNNLAPQASYSATVLFNNSSHSWTFTTGSIQPTVAPGVQQGLNVQAKYDDLWGQKQQDLYKNYPWYDQLPISTSDYFLSFDIGSNTLYADLFPKDPANVIAVNQLKQTVLQVLKSIGVNTSRVSIQWTINTTSASPTP